MSNINVVIIEGNLTRDAELKYTNSGMAVLRGSIACNEYLGGENNREEVSFFDFVLFGKRAEGVASYLTKGVKIFIQGRLKQDRWTDKETNATRSKVELQVRELSFGGSGPKADGGGQRDSGSVEHYGDGRTDAGDDGFEDDIPF